MTDYEEVRQRIMTIPVAPESGSRNVEWITAAGIIGVARDSGGRVELLLRGPKVVIASSTVRSAAEYRLIFRDDGTSFEATRLVFPALAHFDQLAALICTELARNGADDDLLRAFTETEPIIEFAIQSLRISDQALVGLAGELLLLEALCRRADGARVAAVVAGWDGWQRSSRDLVLGDTGIEVKTTTGNTSSHLVEGVHQIERNEDGKEGRLLLVSIGLQRADSSAGDSFTVPSLVERILTRMAETGASVAASERFVAHVKEYGANSWSGYDHDSQSLDPSYADTFLISFFRAYDMNDAGIEVLRRQDVIALRHVVDGSVRFRIDLSSGGVISAGNPVEGANHVAQLILGL